MVVVEALPSSYDTLKTLTVTTVTNISILASDTLIVQILREEKHKENQNSASALVTKQGKSSDNSKSGQKSKKGKNRLCCTNPKC